MQQINIYSIPEELKALNNWVLWKLELDKKGKPTKKPKQLNGKNAVSTNKNTWSSFQKVIEMYTNSNGYYDGIGFMFSDSDYAGIDLDECIDNGIINQFAQDIINRSNSYTEISQSGTGIHIIVKGSIPSGVKRKKIEVYSKERYFTFNGNRINENIIVNAQELLNELYSKYKGTSSKATIVKNNNDKKEINIDEMLNKALTSKICFKFDDLYSGNWRALYSSQSEADQALCNYLAFFLDKDFDSIDTAFRNSGLYRDKWEREDYRTATINNAIATCEKSYQESKEDQKFIIENYDFSDLGIAQSFKDKYKDVLKYAVDTKYFYHWNGKKWAKYDDELPISSMAIEFVKDLAYKLNIYIQSLNDDADIKTYRKIVSKLKNDRTIGMISKRYKSFSDTHIFSSIMDNDVKYINCNNGVIDTITGMLLPHNRELYISKIVNTDYIPNKVNELYKKAVSRLFNGDKEEIAAFEILLGYMLSGRANQKSFPIIHGCKDSGKSKIFELILAVFGTDYAKTIDKELLMRAWNKTTTANPELAELQGIRLLICSETNESDYFNTDFIKKLVGGDTIKARPLYKPPIDFRPIFTPVIFTNGKPSFDGNDDALVGRLIAIELLYPLKKDEIDPNFEQKVLMDKEGMFSYLVGCIVKFNAIGRLIIPVRWENSKQQYVSENNPYRAFVKEVLEMKTGYVEFTREVYAAFEKWCAKEGTKKIPTPKKVTIELKKLGLKHTKRGGAVYLDVYLLPQWRKWDYESYFKEEK